MIDILDGKLHTYSHDLVSSFTSFIGPRLEMSLGVLENRKMRRARDR